MAVVKTQLFFTGTSGYGWTEDYWYRGTDDLNQRQIDITILVTNRANLMSYDCRISRVRMARNIKRFPEIFGFSSATYAQGQITEHINDPNDSVLIRIESNTVGFNQIFMRGLPDSMVVANNFQPSVAWLNSFDVYANGLINGRWGVNSILGSQTPTFQATSATPFTPKGFLLTVPKANTLVPGKQVRISGVSVFGYNGVKNVVADRGGDATTNVYLMGGAQPPAPVPNGSTINVTPLNPTDSVINDVLPEQYTLRKAGRSFGQRRGRARTQLSLRP